MSIRIAVIDYGIGNLRSAEKALERTGARAKLTSNPADIDAADAVVLPGVGNFGRCLEALRRAELADATVAAARSGRPFLGICVGMQMLFEASEESPETAGLALLPGRVERLPDTVKRPQMQWNPVAIEHGARDSARCSFAERVAADLDGAWMYFVHSYAVLASEATIATCSYGGPVVAVAGRDNVVATQFHPEKSGPDGLAFLQAFSDQAGQP